jgi:hypothetical protein
MNSPVLSCQIVAQTSSMMKNVFDHLGVLVPVDVPLLGRVLRNELIDFKPCGHVSPGSVSLGLQSWEVFLTLHMA